MFAVAIGRLAYADPPETLPLEFRDGLKKLVGEYNLSLLSNCAQTYNRVCA